VWGFILDLTVDFVPLSAGRRPGEAVVSHFEISPLRNNLEKDKVNRDE
jgi:hypothetical protein